MEDQGQVSTCLNMLLQQGFMQSLGLTEAVLF